MGIVVAVGKTPPYRITMVDRGWHVVRPHASLAHAFEHLDEALAFVQSDSDGSETIVEIVVGNLYMVKQLASAG